MHILLTKRRVSKWKKRRFPYMIVFNKPEEISINSNDLQKQGERDENVGSDHRSVICSNSGRANKASFSKCGN